MLSCPSTSSLVTINSPPTTDFIFISPISEASSPHCSSLQIMSEPLNPQSYEILSTTPLPQLSPPPWPLHLLSSHTRFIFKLKGNSSQKRTSPPPLSPPASNLSCRRKGTIMVWDFSPSFFSSLTQLFIFLGPLESSELS